jgi:2-amino-4-hydroxy-6-hydroxymethyldihydropteridine diphosphokinase
MPPYATPETKTAYIALGSNLASVHGGPQETLGAVIERLGSLGRVVAVSSFYETDPVGFQAQPVFINAVLALATRLDPQELLSRMLVLEREFGRRRDAGVPQAPRTLDLDLLTVEDLVIRSEGLEVPHPAMAERRFVLAPLAEIAPALLHPVLGRTIAQLLEELPDAGENRISAVRKTGIRPVVRSQSG